MSFVVQPNVHEWATGEDGKILSTDEQKRLGWYARDQGGESTTAYKKDDHVMCITPNHHAESKNLRFRLCLARCVQRLRL